MKKSTQPQLTCRVIADHLERWTQATERLDSYGVA